MSAISASSLVVQKFGGTSVATPERVLNVAKRIQSLYAKKIPLVVVVSAMGDTTDNLISLAEQVSAEPPAREMDMLLSAGERISMALLSMALSDLGVPAISLTGSQSGIITNATHRRARIVRILGDRIRVGLENNQVVIVAGFQGVSEFKEVTTLGRGGSDTSAVALAAALGAERCEIYTDVDGVFSADPREIPHAYFYNQLPHSLALEVALRGASVLHPRCIELARSYQVPVWVMNSLRNTNRKTELVSDVVWMHNQKRANQKKLKSGENKMESAKVIAVTAARQRAWVQTELTRIGSSQAIWDWSKEKGLALYSSVQLGLSFSFFIDKECESEWKELLALSNQDGFIKRYSIDQEILPFSVVVENLSQDSTIVSKIWEVLKTLSISPVVFEVGTLAITLGIRASDEVRLLETLHEQLEPFFDKALVSHDK